MTLQQIAHIKATYKGLKLMKFPLTRMYTDEKWAAVFKIEILHSTELEPLMDYIKKEDISAFIGNGNLFLQ